MTIARGLVRCSWGLASFTLAAACTVPDGASPELDRALPSSDDPAAVSGAPPADAPESAPVKAVSPRPAYLALGDSIAFGYNLDHVTYLADGTAKNRPNQAAHAVGYPEALVKLLAEHSNVKIEVANTSCPGEASGSLVSGKHIDDNNCWENRQDFALHYTYDHKDYDHRDGTEAKSGDYGAGTSQLSHAVSFLGSDPNSVKLITITAGANDALKFAGAACKGAKSLGDKACFAAGALDAVFNKVEANWVTILSSLAQAGYTGPIVAVLYYSPGYQLTDLPTRAGIKLLNAKIHDGVKAALTKHPTMKTRFVESYDVFEEAAKSAAGDACKAGLLMPLTHGPRKGTCDEHASNHGEALLADAVWRSLDLSEQLELLATGSTVP